LSIKKGDCSGKVQALGGTVRKVKKLKIMSRERTKQLKVMVRGLRSKKRGLLWPHYESKIHVSQYSK